jgi:hypothetical protein
MNTGGSLPWQEHLYTEKCGRRDSFLQGSVGLTQVQIGPSFSVISPQKNHGNTLEAPDHHHKRPFLSEHDCTQQKAHPFRWWMHSGGASRKLKVHRCSTHVMKRELICNPSLICIWHVTNNQITQKTDVFTMDNWNWKNCFSQQFQVHTLTDTHENLPKIYPHQTPTTNKLSSTTKYLKHQKIGAITQTNRN